MPPPVPYVGIYVDRSPEDVFAYVLDIAMTPEWRPRMSHRVDHPRRARSRQQTPRRRHVPRVHLPLRTPDHRMGSAPFLRLQRRQGPIVTDSFMRCLPDGDGCRFFTGGDPRSTNWLVGMLRPLFEGSLVRQNLGDLERLQGIMESGLDRAEPPA